MENKEVRKNDVFKFSFNAEKGWFQRTKSGNDVYANKTYGHGKVLGGANEFAKANEKPLRSAAKFPDNPQGISDTILYHCLRHDYVYYPHKFNDADGNVRQRGFYDENADFHPNIKIMYYPQSDGAVCKYCGHNTIFDVNIQNVSDLWCSQCGAEIDYMKTLGEEADFLVYADCFRKGKKLEVKESPHTPYVPPKENPSYHREWKKRDFSEKSYSDYLKETFGPGESVQEDVIYPKNIDAPLEYIKTREYNPAPVKKWEPNKELIIKSNTEGYGNEDSFRGFSFEENEGKDVKVKHAYLDDNIELQYIKTRPYNPAPVKPWVPSQNDKYRHGTDETGEELSRLSFDEPLEFIKSREYRPAPVVQQTYHPENYTIEYIDEEEFKEEKRRNKKSDVLDLVEERLDNMDPFWTIGGRPSMTDLEDVYGKPANQRGEDLKPLSFDEPLTAIKTREYKPAPVVQQTYHPERYEVITETEEEYKERIAKEHTEQVLSILEDIKDVFSTLGYTASDVANMKDLSDKTRGKYPAEEEWSVSDDADYGMFRRNKFE